MTQPALHRLAVPVAVALAVLALVGGISYLAGRGGDTVTGPGASQPGEPGGGADGSAGSGPLSPGPGGEPAPQTPATDRPLSRFTEVSPGADGRSLTVTFWGGVKECFDYTVTARESEQDVALRLVERSRHDGPCIELAQEHSRQVRLAAPLAAREVVDAETGTALLAPSP